MRRFAAHYVWFKDVCPLCYIELDDERFFNGVYPLDEEIAGTAFYDGVLIPVLSSDPVANIGELVANWRTLTQKIGRGDKVFIYHLSGIPLTSAKLGADYGRGNGHIERF